jgi:hypothetical protein
MHNPSCPLCRHDLTGWKPDAKNEDKALAEQVKRMYLLSLARLICESIPLLKSAIN